LGLYSYNKWKYVEKENVAPMDDTILSEIIRIQTDGFETKGREGVRRYSKKLRKILCLKIPLNKYCVFNISLININKLWGTSATCKEHISLQRLKLISFLKDNFSNDLT